MGSALHDAAVISQHLSPVIASRLHGATSCLGVMTQDGMAAEDGAGLGVFAIFDPDGDYGTGMAPAEGDPRAAARRAVVAALDAADRVSETPDLVWISASPGAEEEVLRGISDEIGTQVPIVGGSAADNDLSGKWYVHDGIDCVQDGVIVSVLFPSTPVSIAYQSGYAPAGPSGVVTAAEGRRITEIDDQPAAKVYDAWTNGTVMPKTVADSAPILSESTFTPLGRQLGQVADVPSYLLIHPASVHADGSVETFADVPVGERLYLMQGAVDSLTSRAGRVASFAASRGHIAPEDVAGALMVYCGGCMLAVQDHMDDVVAGVRPAIAGAPFLGVFTFGEQGPILDGRNAHGNLMISCVTFSR